jgi:hypothetical protein
MYCVATFIQSACHVPLVACLVPGVICLTSCSRTWSRWLSSRQTMSPGTCGLPSTTARCCHSGDLRLANIRHTSGSVVLPQCETSIHWSCPELDVQPLACRPTADKWAVGTSTPSTTPLHPKCAQVPAPGGHDVAGGGQWRGHAAAAAAAAAGGRAAGWATGQPGGRSRREGGLDRRFPAHHSRRCAITFSPFLAVLCHSCWIHRH